MAEKECPISAADARGYLHGIAGSKLGKEVLMSMGLGVVAGDPGGGPDDQTVKIAVKVSLAIYRQFKPRSRRGLTWGPRSDDDAGGDRAAGGAVGVGKGRGKRGGV